MKKENDRKAVLRLARRIGCQGAHQNEKGEWLPCGSTEELMRISNAAETRLPTGLKAEETDSPPPCIGCEGAERKRRGAGHKKRWERFRERGVLGIDTLPDGGLTSAPIAGKSLDSASKPTRVILSEKALTDRQQALYDGFETVAEKFGKFTWGTGPDGSHYTPADKNPFIEEKLVCSNCAFWLGPNGCEIVAGKLDPNAICKFWVIDKNKLSTDNAEKSVSVSQEFDSFFSLKTNNNNQETKSLGAAIGRRRKRNHVRRVQIDPNAIDGDADGIVQEGTTAERPTPKRGIRAVSNAAMGAVNSVKKYRPQNARDRLQPRVVEQMHSHFKEASQKALSKRGIDDLESLSQNEIEVLLKKEFPNVTLKNFSWKNKDGKVSSLAAGQVMAFFMFSDSIDANHSIRKKLTYIDNDGTWLKEVNMPSALGLHSVVMDEKTGIQSQKLSFQQFDVKNLAKDKTTVDGLFYSTARSSLISELQKGNISRQEYEKRHRELEKAVGAAVAFHEIGHLLSLHQATVQPFGEDTGYEGFFKNAVKTGRVTQEQLDDFSNRFWDFAKKNNLSAIHSQDDLENMANMALFETLKTKFAQMSDGPTYWADSLNENETNTLRGMLAQLSDYANVLDSQRGLESLNVMNEGIAELVAELLTFGSVLNGVRLNDEQNKILKKMTDWMGI